jgi:hypothetical protein
VAEERRNCDDHYSYSPAQAARVLRVTPTRVRQLLQSGELEGERDAAGHWSIPARAVVDRLERLHRERSLEAAVCDTSSIIREAQERVEALQRELGRLEGRLESGEKARRYLEADRILLAQRLERERLRRENVEQECDELLRRLDALDGPPKTEDAIAEWEGPGQEEECATADAERRSWWQRAFR